MYLAYDKRLNRKNYESGIAHTYIHMYMEVESVYVNKVAENAKNRKPTEVNFTEDGNRWAKGCRLTSRRETLTYLQRNECTSNKKSRQSKALNNFSSAQTQALEKVNTFSRVPSLQMCIYMYFYTVSYFQAYLKNE